MFNFKIKTAVALSCSLLVVAISIHFSHAEPANREIKESTNPILVEARQFDLAFSPPQRADQKKAEELYLRFVQEHPDSPLNPYIFYHLAKMYSSWVDPSWEKEYSLIRDYRKARAFYLEAIERHPPGKFSGTLIHSKVSAAALAEDEEKIVKEYAECYAWLDSLTKKEIAKTIWLSDYQERFVKESPSRLQSWIDGAWANRNTLMDVVATNMISVASRSTEARSKLLNEIVETLPDTEPGKKAAEIISELPPPPPSPPAAGFPWGRVILGLLPLLLLGCVLFLFGRRQTKIGDGK